MPTVAANAPLTVLPSGPPALIALATLGTAGDERPAEARQGMRGYSVLLWLKADIRIRRYQKMALAAQQRLDSRPKEHAGEACCQIKG